MLEPALRSTAAAPPRRPAGDELGALERWLDAGLRRGEWGRLAAEYPLTMGPDGSRRHQCVYAGDRPVAHAMSHSIEVVARGRRLPLGMVGNVFSDPAWRGRGLASACVEAAVAELRGEGACLALLWSDRRELYARLGFQPAGRERLWDLAGASERCAGVASAAARPCDLPALERLYAAKRVRAQRPPGALARLLAAPDTHLALARAGASPLAYAACGRGDDFHGVVHEWAGPPEAVAACVARLRRMHGAHTLLAGPEPDPLEALLARAGARRRDGVFALARILDAERLWRALSPRRSALRFAGDRHGVALHDGTVRYDLDHAQALEIFFGAGPAVVGGLPRGVRRALARLLPWPLYVWGFDSI
jgi:GNAT superfamily N-acetyltransferase